MTKAERTRISRARILDAAIAEFGKNNYRSGVMNIICSEHGVSKGLVYHNFESKEGLYLAALERILSETAEYISKGVYDKEDSATCLSQVIERIREYYDINPLYKNLFYYSTYIPPEGLERQLMEKRKILFKAIAEAFSSFPMKPGVTHSLAEEYAFAVGEGIIRLTKSEAGGISDPSEIGKKMQEVYLPLLPYLTHAMLEA